MLAYQSCCVQFTYKTNNSAGTKIQTTDRSCKLVANSSAIHRAGCKLILLDAAHVTVRAYCHSDGGACASAAMAVEEVDIIIGRRRTVAE